jgi:epoxyqueuosine reductase
MKILLHICCAPCLIYPLKILKSEGHDLTGLFFNPNIHPLLEYRKRRDALHLYADAQEFVLADDNDYPLEDFFRQVAFREEERCRICYRLRLTYTASKARKENFDGFSTTLLYSKYQKHDDIKGIGELLSKEHGVDFVYRDFREGWSEGVRISKALGMYRQAYCGCIFSEKERYS